MTPRSVKTTALDIANASGFLLQLALRDAARTTFDQHGWGVISDEYPWRDDTEECFIDLVLEKRDGRVVVECKRRRNAEWVFIVPEYAKEQTSRARLLWIRGGGG